MTPLFSVVIVNYNSAEYLTRCLKTLKEQTLKSFEIIIVDNGSKDNSLSVVPKQKNVTFIKEKENHGAAKAFNMGAKKAKGTWLAMLNPDIFPKNNWLAELKDAIDTHPDITIFSSLQLMEPENTRIDAAGEILHICGLGYKGNKGYNRHLTPAMGEIFSPSPSSALYRKDVFLQASGYDPTFFRYYEDMELTIRMRLSGERCLFVPKAITYHLGSAITGKTPGSKSYYRFRNHLWMLIKNIPLSLLIIMLPFYLILLPLRLMIQFFKGELIASLKGVKDGIMHLPRYVKQRQSLKINHAISPITLLYSMSCSPLKLLFKAAHIHPYISFSPPKTKKN